MKEQLLEQIKEIVFEEANNGASLTENGIARQLNISRTPVREVLSQLEKEGVLERKQRKGIVLCKPLLKEIVEIYDLRSALEGLAGRLLARMMDEATLKKLKELCSKYNKAKENGGPDSPERAETVAKLHIQEIKMEIIHHFFGSSASFIYPELSGEKAS